jgi:hypothetical protein
MERRDFPISSSDRISSPVSSLRIKSLLGTSTPISPREIASAMETPAARGVDMDLVISRDSAITSKKAARERDRTTEKARFWTLPPPRCIARLLVQISWREL